MDEITPLNKMFDNSQSRQRMEEIRQQAARHSTGRTDGADKQQSAQRAGQNPRAGETAQQQSGKQGVQSDANLPPPTYADIEKSLHAKAPVYTSEGKQGHFCHTTQQDVYARLIKDEERMNELTRGVKEKVSVLFADIRGFTFISSTMPPDRVFTLLNIFLNEMIGVVRDEHGGYIDKIIGDCIMAYFGLPYPTECSRKAADAAVDMQRRMPHVNDHLEKRGLPHISIGIGMNTGIVRAGFTTTEKQISGFTIVGETVNLAAKYEGIAGRGEIVAGPNTIAELGGAYPAEEHEFKVRITNENGEYREHAGYRILWNR